MTQSSELKKRMRSVQAISKMTRAMQLISSVKVQQARQVFYDAMPFFAHAVGTLQDILRYNPDFTSPPRKVPEKVAGEDWKILIFVLSGDRGLAGSYNYDVVKAARQLLDLRVQDAVAHGFRPDVELRVLGRMGREALEREGYPVRSDLQMSLEQPEYTEAARLAEDILEDYEDGLYDEIYLVYTRMVSALVREPIYTKLLPASRADIDYLFTRIKTNPETKLSTLAPDPRQLRQRFEEEGSLDTVLDYLYSTATSGMVFGALTEAYASEQSARMISMETASDNSAELLQELRREQNHIRQSGITRELLEIAAGAEVEPAAEE